jgi:hypothetical protein
VFIVLAWPQLDKAAPQKGDESSGVSAIYLAMINLAVIGFYVVAKKAQSGELFGPPREEGEGKEGEEGAVSRSLIGYASFVDSANSR